MRRLARIDGQTRDRLVELTTRLSDVLAVLLEEHTAKILDHVVELVHVVDVLLRSTFIGIEPIGLKGCNMIQHL